MGSQLDLISVLWYVEWLHLHYPPSLKICEFFTLQTWKNISAVILCHTTMATWLVTGFAHVCSWCFSDCVPSVSGNGACRHGWECWEERKQPGWHVDWSIANHCQTGRNPCQLCLPPPSTSVWISGRHARWHSKFVTRCKDLQLCFHYFICHRFSGEYDTVDFLLANMELITSVFVRLCAILIINFF